MAYETLGERVKEKANREQKGLASMYEKYRRHKLNSVYLNSDEFNRLRVVSSLAPGPTLLWGSLGSLPPFEGPDGLELRWRKSDGVAVLGSEEQGMDFFAVGPYCYILPLAKDQICSWYESQTVGTRSPTMLFQRHVFRRPRWVQFQGLHFIMMGTRLLQRLAVVPNLEERRKTGKTPVEFVSGLIAETEVPLSDKIGKFTHQFPEAMRSIRELLVLGFLQTRNESRAIYVIRPSEDTVEALPMRWWNKGDYDYGYEWVTKLARDPVTGNIVGEGVRILPFLLDQSGNFLGWMEESKSENSRP